MQTYKILFIALMFVGCGPRSKYPRVEIRTELGDVEVELYNDKAPKSVAAFLANVDAGYYTDAHFYRVLNNDNQPSNAPKSEVIQGGIWRKKKKPDTVAQVPHESTNQTGIHHTNGVLSFARMEPGTAGSEFFICIGDQPGYDYGGENNADGQGYAAFGKVIKGMNVVMKIYNRPEHDQYFDPPVNIFSIKRL